MGIRIFALLFASATAFLLAGCAQMGAQRTGDQTVASGTSQDGSPQFASMSSLEARRSGVMPSSGPLKETYFDFDRYDLRADARDVLKANAEWLRGNISARVEIEGHADERGTNEYNLALGAKRAEAAKSYLITLGISPERISTISYGEELLACKEPNEACWQKNRRDRFVVISSTTVN